MGSESENKQPPKNSGIGIPTFLMGAVLTVLILAWENPPTNGIVIASFLLLIGFSFFLNGFAFTMKIEYLTSLDKQSVDMKAFVRTVIINTYFIQLGIAVLISVFSLLGYKYLIDFSGVMGFPDIIALLLPIVFLGTVWGFGVLYFYVSGEKRQRNKTSNHELSAITARFYRKGENASKVGFIVNGVFLVLIILDYLGIITLI